MKLPPQLDTRFAQFLQELPADYHQQAYAFKAFAHLGRSKAIAIDLINLSLHQVEVTTDKEGENLDHYTLAAGDVVLIDRGYNQPKTLVPFIDRCQT